MKNLQANKASKCGRTNCKTIEDRRLGKTSAGKAQKNRRQNGINIYGKKERKQEKRTQSAEQMEQLTEAKMANNHTACWITPTTGNWQLAAI